MQLINARNIKGFIIRRDGVELDTPKYVYCPITDGLRCMKKCKRCESHAGYDNKYKSVWCLEHAKVNVPKYLNR